MGYSPSEDRYQTMKYFKVGNSGLKLPALSLGMWHNFGTSRPMENSRAMLRTAFDLGITHFDLANNYGPPPCTAEETVGRLLKDDFSAHRDELVISTKAGYWGWNGPYGDGGSRKYLVSSLDQSLKRLGLSYVDIFYHHRPDPNTPLEETMGALDYIVRSGRALYVGISNYDADQSKQAIDILKSLGTPCLIHQAAYSMLERTPEKGLIPLLESEDVGMIAFVPLAQGLLTGKYLNGIPADSRAASDSPFLKEKDITEEKLSLIRKLNDVAAKRGQTLSQMALAWVLRKSTLCSAIIGASKPEQIVENAGVLEHLDFTPEELQEIDTLLQGGF